MSDRRAPAVLARDAVVSLAVGLSLLTVAAVVLYRPGAPRWTHVVINGTGWALVLSTGAMLAVAAVEKLVDVGRRHLPH